MDNLASLLSGILTAEMKVNAESAFLRDMSSQSKDLRVLPPDTISQQLADLTLRDIEAASSSNTAEERNAWIQAIIKNATPRYPPLERLPCAHVEVEKYHACEKPGTMACAACKLVSYCSKDCQTAHWKAHKQDCKNWMRSDDWEPTWVREGRPPSFVKNQILEEEIRHNMAEDLSVGASLWGNTPAMDLINLAYNEKDATKDFSLAFIASGDLRHVMRTINSLPSHYSGRLNIFLNDCTPSVVCRNIILLLILENIPDDVIAADIALHFWYSAFMPVEYRLRISCIITSFLQRIQAIEDVVLIPPNPHSVFSCLITRDVLKYFSHFTSESTSIGQAQDEYTRVRTAPSRHDFRDRMYARLRPSHRVAFQEFRRFGIVLPFGAVNAHFNCPNLSLFSPAGKWFQTDYADPLAGWDIGSVIKAGKLHGATSEDIYGCLYFFLSDQLRLFAQRLRKFRISFTISAFDACILPSGIREDMFSEYGIPSSIRFDRIEVSNIFDANYVGLHDVLTSWAPLLSESRTAIIVGYFMNWIAIQQNGRATMAGDTVLEKLFPRVIEKNKYKKRMMPNPMDVQNVIYLIGHDIDALYENSKPFSAFLKKQGLANILRKTNLKLRDRHTIVPHRDMAPLQGLPDALPEYPDDETWYNHTKITCSSQCERYVEFSRV